MVPPNSIPHTMTRQHDASRSDSLSSSRVKGTRSQSQNSENTVRQPYPRTSPTPVSHQREESAASSASGKSVRDGVGNLNRWSQSTTSSQATEDCDQRQSHPGRLSNGKTAPISSAVGFANSRDSPTRNAFGKPHSPPSSPDRWSKKPPRRGNPSLSWKTSTATVLQESFEKSTKISDDSPIAQTADAATTSAALNAFAGDGRLAAGTYVEDSRDDEWGGRSSPTAANRSEHRPTTPSTITSRHPRNHSRNESGYGNGNGNGSGNYDTIGTESSKEKKHRRYPSQKAMLSKALQKANTAVLLDNAQNFEGAMESYHDACNLLEQVMARTPVDEDRRKLQAIRTTYLNRIVELQNIDISFQVADGKALPERPISYSSTLQEDLSVAEGSDASENDTPVVATARKAVDQDSIYSNNARNRSDAPPYNIPPRRRSLLPSALERDVNSTQHERNASNSSAYDHRRDLSRGNRLAPPMDSEFMPAPLSPGRAYSNSTQQSGRSDSRLRSRPQQTFFDQHSREPSQETTSWLDTIDESGASSSTSSVHSRSSSVGGLRRKDLRPLQEGTETEFEAALDAAVEAAYDDGYELNYDDNEEQGDDAHFYLDDDEPIEEEEEDLMVETRRSIVLAGERAREAEREAAIHAAKDRAIRRYSEQGNHDSLARHVDYDDDEADEEERILEEMTRGYVMDDKEYNLHSKSALPRESDSSGFSARTWGSSVGSSLNTTGSSLTTVAEVIPRSTSPLPPKLPPPRPPPSIALPQLPTSGKKNDHHSPPITPPATLPPTTSLPPIPQSQHSATLSSGRPPTAPPSIPLPQAPLPHVASASVQDGHADARPVSPLLDSSHLASLTTRPLSPANPHRPGLGLSPGQQSVRERRLSGQNAKELKIETSAKLQDIMSAPKTMPTVVASVVAKLNENAQSASAQSSFGIRKESTPRPAILEKWQAATEKARSPSTSPNSDVLSAGTTAKDTVDMPALTKTATKESEIDPVSQPPSPSRLRGMLTHSSRSLRKNFSSASLRSRNLSLAAPELPDISPSASMNSMFGNSNQARKAHAAGAPIPPTPMGNTFSNAGFPNGGFYLFECDMHSSSRPGSPNPEAENPPVALEPCPKSALLRPFWLMRCLYQTIAHPHGGYLSKKLFVPRDVWHIKVSKVKYLDEKISQCDYLTAALSNISKVDTFDADAVLMEMQSFETILDQVQTILNKRLGNDVGIHGVASMMKAAGSHDNSGTGNESGSRSSTGKISSTWRKLRSKSSGNTLTAIAAAAATQKDPSEYTLESVPMTTLSEVRFAKRDPTQIHCDGPNANYMAALARLFDAAQILDEITRQIEDPGLRASNSTQVGLELCARHAAEFFAFYICRFVLADLGLLLNKFLKKATEWVLV